ncbi:MAG: pentapeptide repeat-containing protein [Candidatus Peribacteraceae bacterium]
MVSVLDERQDYSEEQFENMNLIGEEITGKEFEQCSFRKCRFLQCTFTRCRFIDCTFSESMLSAIKFIECSFMETVFQDCKAIGINWTRAGKTLRGLQFIDSDLSQSVFCYLKLPQLVMKRCIAKNVDFSETDCAKADFEGTDFERSIFLRTNLTETNFKRAFNYTIDARSNILKKTKFSLPEAVSLLSGLDIVLDD